MPRSSRPRREAIREFRGEAASGEPEPFRYLAIGRIIGAHGTGGEVAIEILTDFPERFETTEWVYLGDEREATPYRLESYRWHKQKLLLTLDHVTDRAAAKALRGQWVQVPRDEAMPLPEGHYYHFQLIGLEVVTTQGEPLGTLADILETGANDVWVVRRAGREVLLPDIPDVVKSIDMAQKRIMVELLDGLI